MYELGGVQIVDGLAGLIYNVPAMLISKHIFPDEGVEIDIHKLEENVDISFIVRFYNLFEFDDIGMFELLQEHDLAIGSLCIRWVLEGIKIFF